MTHSLIHFFTNEHVPQRLHTAIEELKQKQNKNLFKKDRHLFALGSFFLFVFLCLIALLVYSIITLF